MFEEKRRGESDHVTPVHFVGKNRHIEKCSACRWRRLVICIKAGSHKAFRWNAYWFLILISTDIDRSGFLSERKVGIILMSAT